MEATINDEKERLTQSRAKPADTTLYASSDESEEDEPFIPVIGANIDIVPHQSFIEALPHCTLLDMGFHVFFMPVGEDRWCFCPCGGQMQTWRDRFVTKFSGTINPDLQMKKICDNKRFTDLGIVAHLQTKAEFCDHHRLTYIYLRNLYKDFAKPGLMHKAMYNLNDPNYKRAQNEESKSNYE